MKVKLVQIPVVAAVFLVGCIEPCKHYNRLEVAAYASHAQRKPYGSVANVYMRPEDIKRPYEVVGMLSCEGNAGEEAGILNAMLYHAADMGADGVLLDVPQIGAEDLSSAAHTQIDLRAGWATMIGSGNSNRRAYRCQVIRFKDIQ